jgi:hypothetical protein
VELRQVGPGDREQQQPDEGRLHRQVEQQRPPPYHGSILTGG